MKARELNITEDQVSSMVGSTARNVASQINAQTVRLVASDSYGESLHRTWAFLIQDVLAYGSIERYWGGLKMICSVLNGSPRTSFFKEDGTRTTNKDLRDSRQGSTNGRGELNGSAQAKV